MKRILSASICLLLLFSLAISASATGVKVTFTSDSLPQVGGTLTVDKNALMDNDSITAEMYNAMLEGNVIYSWYKNGIVTKEGTGADALSYQLTVSDQGCTLYVKVSFYEDDSFRESKKCGEAASDEITVSAPPAKPDSTSPVNKPTEPPASDPLDTPDMDNPNHKDNSQDFPWWGYAMIALGGIGVGIGMTLVFVKVKKKA